MKKYFMMVIAMTMMTIGFVSCSASDDEMGETVSRVTTDESGFSLLSYSMTAGSAVSEESNSRLRMMRSWSARFFRVVS